METDLRKEAEAIFQNVIDQPAHRHAALVDELCGPRAELRCAVRSLLDLSDDVLGGFMNTPPASLTQFEPMPVPERVGRFLIERQIGEGGMGLVYAARQENPARTVALKLLRPGIVSPSMLRRFHQEVAALATLNHAGIAHIYEAGTMEGNLSGARFEQPYFAMELVDGEPLTHYAARKNLSIPERLELFLYVCDAVQHAHQKGIIHRDLKPANILVESTRVAKVLDFGVARIASNDFETRSMQTQSGQLIGTLAYMSPEQAAGDKDRLDTRSDVYSLGVVLFELMTGRLPYEVSGKSLATVAKIISETRHLSLKSIDRRLSSDLDTIVSKALEKDPSRRYASVHALADDLRRFLAHDPITARQPSAFYLIKKFSRRNRGLVAAAGVAVVVLVAGVLVGGWLAFERGVALRESERQKLIAEAVNEFLTKDLLASADPGNQPNRNISLREVLDRAALRIDHRFHNAPSLEASIRTTLSNTYKALGEYNPALTQAKGALELLQTSGFETDRELIQAMNRVASLERSLGRFTDAEKRFRDSYGLALQAFGPEDETTLSILNNLALLLEKDARPAEAARILEEVVGTRMRVLGEQHEKTMTSINNLALVYVTLGRYDEAEPLYLKELEYSKRTAGPEHPGTLISINNLAVMYVRRGEPLRAEPLVRQALEARTRILGPDHPHTIESLGTLGDICAKTGRTADAEQMLTDALQRCERSLGQEHPLTKRVFTQRITLVGDHTQLRNDQSNDAVPNR